MKYRTIVVDPPWHYDSWPGSIMSSGSWLGRNRPDDQRKDNKRRRPIGYQTLTVAEIAALPVCELAEPRGCHLYLWTTNHYLPYAFGIVSAWGFRYSQTIIWAKTPMGLGPGGTFAQNAEFCLFARRGSLRHNQRLDSVWFNWPRLGHITGGSHSRKPEHFIDMVEKVSPGPYVELFARRQRLGWDVWGNESGNTAELSA